MVAAEVAPFAHTGGLGDVLGGLSLALANLGVDVVVVTPRYGVTTIPEATRWWADTVPARVGAAEEDVCALGVLETRVSGATGSGFRVCFLDYPTLFARDGIYGDAHGAFGDNDVRFAVMCRGALSVASRIWPADGEKSAGPDVIHAHDWHAALAIVSSRLTMDHDGSIARTVFTIHNLAFQGVFGAAILERLGLPRAAYVDGTLEHDGQVNLLQGAVALADRVTTVSPTYALEIADAARRLRARLRLASPRRQARRDPQRDRRRPVRPEHGPDDRHAVRPRGSPRGQERLQARARGRARPRAGTWPPLRVRLPADRAKGINLLLSLIPGLVAHGASFALVGTGDAPLERALGAVAERFPVAWRAGSRSTRSCPAVCTRGADYFVVPSRYEPCGLTQLYAMRYGSIPIVTAVGGLRDTVTPISALFSTGTGLVATSPDAAALLVACEDAPRRPRRLVPRGGGGARDEPRKLVGGARAGDAELHASLFVERGLR